jgi:FkbM family methyltransferase
MRFLYGYDATHYTDITDIVLKKCLKNNTIFIPMGDGNRCNTFGCDPYPNVLKHIVVIDFDGQEYIYDFTKEVHINLEPITKQLTDYRNPKIWWNSNGKFISDPVERLAKLQKHINLHYVGWGGFEYEYPEQLMAIRFLDENSVVLEIGGNVGRVSHIIQCILNNPKHHVIMGCDAAMAKQLRYNLDLNTFTSVPVETAALSKTKLYVDGSNNPRPLENYSNTENIRETPTISYSELCVKYNLKFNTLVADCEGSLYYIFKEDPDMLDNIGMVIMENDYREIEHKIAVDNILKQKGFTCVYQEKGVPWASWSCCYEYFYEVWKKL